jgi:hypothetical protein
MRMIIIVCFIIIFIMGFIVLLNNEFYDMISPLISSCPNLLVRNGNKLSLLNTNITDSVITFETLEDYKNYVERQKVQGIYCPVLYIQKENNAQGNDIYKMYSDPCIRETGFMTIPLSNIESMEGVLDASKANPPFNANSYPGFDPHGLNVGQVTALDKVHDSTKLEKESDNAMDNNWSGN